MKKYFAFVCLLMILFSSFALPVLAEEVENEDSLSIDKWVRANLEAGLSDAVVRIYRIHPYDLRYRNIDDLLANNDLGFHYAIQDSNGEWIQKCREGYTYIVMSGYSEPRTALDACIAGDVVKHIGSDVVVYNTYYLSGAYAHGPSGIYYKTSKGDYLYFYDLKKEYLVPIEAFRTYAQIAYEKMKADGTTLKIGAHLDVSVYLSAYDIHSPDFNLDAPLPGEKTIFDYFWILVVLAVIVIPVGVYFYCRKRALHKLIRKNKTEPV